MPYLNSMVSVNMTQEQIDRVKTRIGQAINEMPGKSEKSLMIGFQHGQAFYFHGEAKEKAALIELKMLNTQTVEAKEEFTGKVCDIYFQVLGIPAEDIFVVFTEVEKGNWGWNKKLV